LFCWLCWHSYGEAESVARSTLESATAHYGAESELTAIAQINLAAAIANGAASGAKASGRERTDVAELLDAAERSLNAALGSENPYTEAIAQSRQLLDRLPAAAGGAGSQSLDEGERSVVETISSLVDDIVAESRASAIGPNPPKPINRTTEVAPPKELASVADAAHWFGDGWEESVQPLLSCDPRGMLARPSLLRHELDLFVRAWKEARLPWDESLAVPINDILSYSDDSPSPASASNNTTSNTSSTASTTSQQ
jgi:hypothetical protein